MNTNLDFKLLKSELSQLDCCILNTGFWLSEHLSEFPQLELHREARERHEAIHSELTTYKTISAPFYCRAGIGKLSL